MAESPIEIRVHFELLSQAAQNIAINELNIYLAQKLAENALEKDLSLDVQRTRADTQDFGTVLAVVLGTPAAIAIAKGIHDYIARQGHRAVIEAADGRVIATGDAAKNIDIAKTVEALQTLR